MAEASRAVQPDAADDRAEFERDPLGFLDRAFAAGAAGSGSAWAQPRQLILGDAAAARTVLADDADLYEPHSDFFHTRRGTFGPRAVQVEMGRAARALLNDHLKRRAGELPALVRRELAPSSEWPDAGNWLVYRHLADALVTPESPARLRRRLDQIVERAVLAGARERRSALNRAVFRFQVMRELTREVEARRAAGRQRPDAPLADLLDVVARLGGAGAPAVDLTRELAEVFLSFLFAVAGSIGFTLGWSLYLLGTHPGTRTEPAWVVREALRLWPVAWLLSRRPARPHEIAGQAVSPEHEVVVCPYAVHRNPRHWDDPHAFRPERWATAPDQAAYIPFGAGPHRCVAAALSLQLVEDVLAILLDGYRMTFTLHESRPFIGPALAPPRFTLGLADGPVSRPQERR